MPCIVSANAPWNGVLKDVEVNPRINVVHVDTLNSNTQYYFLAAIPMVVFHYGDDVLSSLLITDHTTDQTVTCLLDDWETYLDQHPLLDRHANFIGGVSGTVQNEIKTKFGILDEDTDTITGTPIAVANRIAEKDWRYSEYIVIAPYKTTLTNGDIESISNASVIASLLNAPLLFTNLTSISDSTLATIGKLGADKAVLVEIGDVLPTAINSQLSSAGVTVVEDLTTTSGVVGSIRTKASRSTLCGIVKRWQHLAAAYAGARYGGYVLFLPGNINMLANDLYQQILKDPELQSYYKLERPVEEKTWLKLTEQQIAQNFYSWLGSVGGDDADSLETVLTFEPQGTGGGTLETTFERAINADPSDVTRAGAIAGRMPLNWFRNIALINRTGMYRAMIFANPRPQHITLAMNAYEVRYTVNTGSPAPDSWGSNHIINEMFGWPYRGWCADNGYFPWSDIHSNAPDLSPILPPGNGAGADHDPGQFAAFLDESYETHFHSGRNAGTGSHPAQPSVSNIGFAQDVDNGSAFLYFSCHGGGTSIAVRSTDNGIAQDPGTGIPAWGEPYWPDDDERVYDGSAGGSYSQTQLNSDLDNAHGMMIAYNACGMANGYMNEVLLEHGGAASFGSYTSVSFTGSAWWWNLWVYLVTHEGYTIGEAKTYASARCSYLYTPTKSPDNSLRYVLYGDPNCPFVQTDWTSPAPAPINVSYGGHRPDKPANEFAGTVDPDTVQITVPTAVTVTLLDTAGVGVESVFVTIESWSVNLLDTTDASGQAVFNITAPYGELLYVLAEKEEFDAFQDTIYVVGGSDFGSVDISATVPLVGLVDTLTPFYEGTITGTTDQTGLTLYARGCGVDTNTTSAGTSVDLVVTPTSAGAVRGAVAKSGFNLYTENIPVISVYGTLQGAVVDNSTMDSLSNVTVVGYVGGSDTSAASPVFSVVTNQSGVYTVPFQLAVGEYDLYVSLFGYLPFGGTKMVMYGANTYDIPLVPAPSGLIYGWVKESGTMNPLSANLKIYRGDNLELYAEINTDPLTGEYEVNVPYFTYRMRITAYQHIPVTYWIPVDVDSIETNFEMEPTVGNVLVINDDDGSKLSEPKLDKEGNVIEGWEENGWKAGESANLMAELLINLGYYVDTTQAATTDTATWANYDFVVWSCGKDGNPVASSGYRTYLEDWVEDGGKLLIEGGEISYDWDDEDTLFARTVLHTSDWGGDNSGSLNLVRAQGDHPIANIPNPLPSTIEITYTGYGDQDASAPTSDAYVVYDCTADPNYAGILIYDDSQSPQSGQIVFYSFNFYALSDTAVRRDLLQNTAEFLLAQETAPNCWVSGSVNLEGAPDSGAIVTASFGIYSYSDTTELSGSYLIALYPGTYSLWAHKDGYRDSTLSDIITLEGQVTEDVDFTLYPLVTMYSESFDTSDGELASTGNWQWGVPTSGPGSAHSSPNLWATVLAGNYSHSSDSRLETPELLLPPGLADPILTFWHWYDFESGYDGGNVKISVAGGAWQIVDPAVPYPEDAAASGNAAIPNERCYSGHSQKFWERAVFDLAPYVGAGQAFKLRFHFGSDGSVAYPGWYVDDVSVAGVNYYPEVGFIQGTVEDLETSLPLSGAIVTADGETDTTDVSGYYFIQLRPATYTVSARLFGYNTDSLPGVVVTTDDTVDVNFALRHPEIETSPSSFVVNVVQESTLDTFLILTNSGNGELTYDINVAYAGRRGRKARQSPEPKLEWLIVEPMSGTVAPGTSEPLFLHLSASGLAVGSSYGATVSINNNCSSGRVDVPVSMTVQPPYACGDCNGDGRITIADATYVVTFIYRGGPAPIGPGDVNVDGRITIADATYLVAFVYRGGPPPCEPPVLLNRQEAKD